MESQEVNCNEGPLSSARFGSNHFFRVTSPPCPAERPPCGWERDKPSLTFLTARLGSPTSAPRCFALLWERSVGTRGRQEFIASVPPPPPPWYKITPHLRRISRHSRLVHRTVMKFIFCAVAPLISLDPERERARGGGWCLEQGGGLLGDDPFCSRAVCLCSAALRAAKE